MSDDTGDNKNNPPDAPSESIEPKKPVVSEEAPKEGGKPTVAAEENIDTHHVKVPPTREENEVSIKDPIAETTAKAGKEVQDKAEDMALKKDGNAPNKLGDEKLDDNETSAEKDQEDKEQDEQVEEKLSAKDKALSNPQLKQAISFFKTKGGKITAGVMTTLLLTSLLAVKACEPTTGGALFRVCHAFLEQQITYPETIEHKYVEQYPLGTRIYYNHTDGFGQSLGEYIECSFESDPQVGLQLKGVVFSTIKVVTKKTTVKNKGRLYAVEQKIIDRFNRAYSTDAILKQEQPLPLPPYNPYFL